MFDNNISVEPIPERVFELCKMVSKKTDNESAFSNMMEPKALNPSSTRYFGIIRNVAIELKLIEKKDDMLEYVADKSIIKNLDNFRKYCNSLVWKDADTYFYRISRCFLESNDQWFKYSTLTNINITNEIRTKTNIMNVKNEYMLGLRFWLSFLGFGYIHEDGKTMNFLPNMYIAMKDFLLLCDFEKDREYSVSDFFGVIIKISPVIVEDEMLSKNMNLALSNALRQLHDNKEIVLKHNLDSKEVWHMFKNTAHQFTSDVTHIIYKGVKL